MFLEDVDATCKGKGFCYVHNRSCECPTGASLLVAGFICKSISMQNSKQWTSNPTDDDAMSQATFTSIARLILKMKPRYFLLENVFVAKLLGGFSMLVRGLEFTQPLCSGMVSLATFQGKIHACR